MTACRFCDIVSGGIEANKVFEDEEFFAFLDARPVFLGHCLLVPKQHVETVMDTPDKILSHMGGVLKKLSTAVKKAMSCDGILLITNNVVSQSVPHLHVHVIPRNKGDGLRGFMWPRQKYKDKEEEKSTAKKIAEEMNRS